METAEAVATLAANPDYRVLQRLAVADEHVFAGNVTGEACARLAVIDTETTGLKPDLGARIIELAIATCEYGLTSGTLYRVVDRYESLEDPEEPIPPEITRLTGITDDMVRGHHIDEAGIAMAIDRVGLCICHNLAFGPAPSGLPTRIAGSSDVEVAMLDGICAFATWFYHIGNLWVNVMYAIDGERRDGLVHAWHPRFGCKRILMREFAPDESAPVA